MWCKPVILALWEFEAMQSKTQAQPGQSRNITQKYNLEMKNKKKFWDKVQC